MTAPADFNLLSDPWIPATRRDGTEEELSILELIRRASEFTSLSGELPTQVFASIRLLLAFLHRALDGPASADDWADLWEAGAFPEALIADYARRVEHRFNLFDSQVPFMQVADLRSANDKEFGLERIVAEFPNNKRLFTNRSEQDLKSISPAEAARWLIHAHAFDVSGNKTGAVGDPAVKNGKGYPIGPGWSGQIGGVLLQGANLFQTLALNLVSRDAAAYVKVGGPADVPVWERDPDNPAGHQKPPRPPRGAIELYTWQTRRVRLFGDREGVTGVLLANGDKITPHNLHGLEPHSAWRYSEPQSKKEKTTVFMPIRHEADRTVWRGLAALLPCTAGRRGGGGSPQRYLSPGVLQWASDLVAQGMLPDNFRPGIRICGVVYGPQQATVDEVVEDELLVPVAALRADDPAAGTAAVEAVADAEKAAGVVWRLALNIAQAAGADTKNTFQGDTALEELYARLDSPYRAWLLTLTPGSDLIQARQHWRETLRSAARVIAGQLIAQAPPAAWTGRVIGDKLINLPQAEAWFWAGLNRKLPRTTDSIGDDKEEPAA